MPDEVWDERPAATTLRFSAMGGPGDVQLEGGDPDLRRAAARAAVDEVRRIEALWSRYRPDSIVSRINARAGLGVPTEVDAETAAMLAFADRLHAASDGRFDITSGVLRRVWRFDRAERPDPRRLAAAVRCIGWRRVAWDGRHLSLPDRGMEIDLGGLGKEYAADRAAMVMARHGAAHGFVNLAGDLRIVGPRRDGLPWRIGIRDPQRPDATVATVEMTTGGIATSGTAERGFDHDGRRYHHLLDATTGWPSAGWRSVSVVAPTCAAAGALATLAMLAGDAALDLLRSEPVGWLAVDDEGRLHHATADGTAVRPETVGPAVG